MKKIISLALTLALAASFCIPAWAGFADVSGWAEPYINRAAELGLVSGIGDNKFGPDQQVTYGQLATMLVSLKWKGELDAARADGYDSAWWEPYCRVASQHGLFDNTEMGDFLAWDITVNEALDRAGMAVMVYNFMQAAGGATVSASDLSAARSSITDIGHLYTEQADAVAYCYAANLLSGTGNGTFSPDSNMTRAQAATVLCSIYSGLTGEPGDVTQPGGDQPQQPAQPAARPADAIGGQYDTSLYTVPADVNKDGWITQAEVDAVIAQLKVEFPRGTLWNDASVWGTEPSSPNGYVTSAGLHRYVSKAFGGGTGCAAWAGLYSDRIFGNLPARKVDDIYSLNSGDVVHDKTGPHWWAVLQKYSSVGTASMMLATDSGTGASDTIVWDGKVFASELEDIPEMVSNGECILYTRYPAE